MPVICLDTHTRIGWIDEDVRRFRRQTPGMGSRMCGGFSPPPGVDRHAIHTTRDLTLECVCRTPTREGPIDAETAGYCDSPGLRDARAPRGAVSRAVRPDHVPGDADQQHRPRPRPVRRLRDWPGHQGVHRRPRHLPRIRWQLASFSRRCQRNRAGRQVHDDTADDQPPIGDQSRRRSLVHGGRAQGRRPVHPDPVQRHE